MPTGTFIGLGSGLASAVLFYSAARGGVLFKVVLLLLTPLPIMIAGLGFGRVAAIAGALAGALIMAATLSPALGFLFGIAVGGPAILSAYLSDLGRTRADGTTVDWYPAGYVLAALAALGAAIPVILALFNGGSFAALRPQVLQQVGVLAKQMQQAGLTVISEQGQANLADMMISAIPGVLAAYWMILIAINLYLAGRVARASGLLTRPWPDLHQLEIPPWLMLLLAVAIILTMLGGFPHVVGIALAGAIGMALVFYGLSVLHAISAGRVPWLLWLAYAGLLNPLGPYALFPIALIGMLEPLLNLRQRFGKNPAPPKI